MNFRTIETKVKILKYKFDFDMLWIISIIWYQICMQRLMKVKTGFYDFEIYPAHVLKY